MNSHKSEPHIPVTSRDRSSLHVLFCSLSHKGSYYPDFLQCRLVLPGFELDIYKIVQLVYEASFTQYYVCESHHVDACCDFVFIFITEYSIV